MTKHVHAELMMQYAQDAMETDKPWERWQVLARNDLERWRLRARGDSWVDCAKTPLWFEDCEYRRKPRTININRYEVPEPLRTEPSIGTTVYYPDLTIGGLVIMTEYWNTTLKIRLLKKGLLHLTREAAEIHAKALLSFTAEGDK